MGKDADIDVSWDDFRSGFTLFAFNLAPDLALVGHQMPSSGGSMTCHFQFSKTLANAINIVLCAWTDNVVQITQHRDVLKDFE
jgi:hypothetical protein